MKVYSSLKEGYVESNRYIISRISTKASILNCLVFLAVCLFGVRLSIFMQWIPGIWTIPLTIIFVLFFRYPHEFFHAMAAKGLGMKHIHVSYRYNSSYVGSNEEYFDKVGFIIFTLFPVVSISVIFFVLILIVPKEYYIIIWVLEAYNIIAASQDINTFFQVLKMPKTSMFLDLGQEVKVFEHVLNN